METGGIRNGKIRKGKKNGKIKNGYREQSKRRTENRERRTEYGVREMENFPGVQMTPTDSFMQQ